MSAELTEDGYPVKWPSEWVEAWDDFPEENKTIGQDLPCHNQGVRFDNASHLFKYVCVDNMLGLESRKPQFDYIPVCKYPYVNKGWGDDGVEGFDDVVLNDCSITLSQSMGGYDKQCLTMILISLVPVGFNYLFLKMANDAKPKNKRQKRFWFPDKKPTINEQLLWLNVFLGLWHSARCIDPLGYAGRLTLRNFHTITTAFCVAIPVHIGFLLVVSWITIVDGGKSKTTPRWARAVYQSAKYSTYIVEISCGILEYRTGESAVYSAAIDGRVAAIKYLVSVFWYFVGGTLCFVYGQKISNQLKSSKKDVAESPQLKRIKRMCRLSCTVTAFGVLVKLSGVFGRAFRMNQNIPSCKGIATDQIPTFIWITQYVITYIFQPMYQGKRATTALVIYSSRKIMSTAKSTAGRSSRSRKSTGATTNKSGGSSTTGVSTGSSTTGVSTGSSTTSSTTTSSKQSSGWFSSKFKSSTGASGLSDASDVSDVSEYSEVSGFSGASELGSEFQQDDDGVGDGDVGVGVDEEGQQEGGPPPFTGVNGGTAKVTPQ